MKYSVVVELLPIGEQVAKNIVQKIVDGMRQVIPDSAESIKNELGSSPETRWFSSLCSELSLLDGVQGWSERGQYAQVAELRQKIEIFVQVAELKQVLADFQKCREQHFTLLGQARDPEASSNEGSEDLKVIEKASNGCLSLAKAWKNYLNEVPMAEALELHEDTPELKMEWSYGLKGPEDLVAETFKSFLQRADAARRKSPRLCSIYSQIRPQNLATKQLMSQLKIESALVQEFDISAFLLESHESSAAVQEEAESLEGAEFTIVVRGQQSQVLKLLSDIPIQRAV